MPANTNAAMDELSGLFAKKHHIAQKSTSDLSDQPPRKRLRHESVLPFPLHGFPHHITTELQNDLRNLRSRSSVAHNFVLPQCTDYSDWPSLEEWKKGISVVAHRERTGLQIWSDVCSLTHTFLKARLLPYIDKLLASGETSTKFSVLTAFVGLYSILQSIAETVFGLFSKELVDASHEVHEKRINQELTAEDLFDEFDLDDYMRIPMKAPVSSRTSMPSLHASRLFSPASNASNIRSPSGFARLEMTPEPHGSTRHLSASDDEFFAERDAKRRRTMTFTSEHASDTHASIDSVFFTPHGSTSDKKEANEKTTSSDFDCTLLTTEQFYQECILSEENIFKYISGFVQNHFDRFPRMAEPLHRQLLSLYEFYLSAKFSKDGIFEPVPTWDAQVREAFFAAVDVFHKVL